MVCLKLYESNGVSQKVTFNERIICWQLCSLLTKKKGIVVFVSYISLYSVFFLNVFLCNVFFFSVSGEKVNIR